MRLLKTFYDIGQEYHIWIIQYSSSTFTEPIFFVWYSEPGPEGIDRFLTYNSGEIVGFKTLPEVKTTIQNLYATLLIPERLDSWLNAFEPGAEEIDVAYDTREIEAAIEKEDLNPDILNSFIGFINMVGDFAHQAPENDHLLYYRDLDTIDLVWNYFYNSIFWPNAWKEEAEKIYVRPSLEVDYPLLLNDFRDMQFDFEEYIVIK